MYNSDSHAILYEMLPQYTFKSRACQYCYQLKKLEINHLPMRTEKLFFLLCVPLPPKYNQFFSKGYSRSRTWKIRVPQLSTTASVYKRLLRSLGAPSAERTPVTLQAFQPRIKNKKLMSFSHLVVSYLDQQTRQLQLLTIVSGILCFLNSVFKQSFPNGFCMHEEGWPWKKVAACGLPATASIGNSAGLNLQPHSSITRTTKETWAVPRVGMGSLSDNWVL